MRPDQPNARVTSIARRGCHCETFCHCERGEAASRNDGSLRSQRHRRGVPSPNPSWPGQAAVRPGHDISGEGGPQGKSHQA